MTDIAPFALFSIHDVMPETLDSVAELLEAFHRHGLPLPGLLVVAGRRWCDRDLARLHAWEAAGAEMIAHGWHHETDPRGLYHHLHAAVLSRNVAEHLALDHAGVCALMQRAYDWFAGHGLAPPMTYVPPAWALGIAPQRLSTLPFRCVETLSGVLLVAGGAVTRHRLPLLGYEADTRLRALFLRAWNARQSGVAVASSRPLRIAVHPRDHRLLLSDDLAATLARPWTTMQYRDLAPR